MILTDQFKQKGSCMTIYIRYDKNNLEVIRSRYKNLVQAHIAVVLITEEESGE